MGNRNGRRRLGSASLAIALAVLSGGELARAEEPGATRFDLYGWVQLDLGYDTGQVNPDWFDLLRPSMLPAFENQFGEDGRVYAGARQTRFGVKSSTPTALGELRTLLEFDLVGTGVDAGQTAFHLRHAFVEVGPLGAGHTWSPFMDPDVYPRSLEYWPPCGMAFYRNVQLRWTPIRGETRLTIALERPGANADSGVYADDIELENVKPHFPLPDLSAQLRREGGWGHVQLSGILRRIEWSDMTGDQYDLSGGETGWGVNVSANLKPGGGSDLLRLQYVHGEGIAKYMADASPDVAPRPDPGSTVHPIDGELLPVTGVVAFLDHDWSEHWSTSVGWSSVVVDNSKGQAPSAYHRGDFALANLRWTPVRNLMIGGEVQWGRRENDSDGWADDDLRFQLSVRGSFSVTIGGE